MLVKSDSAISNMLNAVMIYLLMDTKHKSMSPLAELIRTSRICYDCVLDTPSTAEIFQSFQQPASDQLSELVVTFGLQSLSSRITSQSHTPERLVCLTTEAGLPTCIDLAVWHVAEEGSGEYRFIVLLKRGSHQASINLMSDDKGVVLSDTNFNPRAFPFADSVEGPRILLVEGMWLPTENNSVMMEVAMDGVFSRGVIADTSGRMDRLFNAPVAGQSVDRDGGIEMTVMVFVTASGELRVKLFPAWSVFPSPVNSKGLHGSIHLKRLNVYLF